VRHHAGDQPPLLGGGSIDHVAGEQHLGGTLAANELRQPPETGDVAAQPAQHEQLTELGALGGHSQVGHQCQLHAPPDGRPVDRGDDRHVGVQQRVGRRGQPWLHRGGLRAVAAAHHLAHVVATAEGRVGAGDHQAPSRGVAHRALELVVAPEAQRVAHLWSVDGDDIHVAHPLHTHVCHGSLLAPYCKEP
jgi:hypothetical protein